MKIFIVFDREQSGLSARLAELTAVSRSDEHYFEFEDIHNADAFLILTHGLEADQILDLRYHPLVIQHPCKSFLWCDRDDPIPILPGLFAGLPTNRMDQRLHRTGFYLSRSNNRIHELKSKKKLPVKQYLASFQGTLSSNIRKTLFRLKLTSDRIMLKTVEQLWSGFIFGQGFDNSESLVNDYAELLLQTKFALCPKGNGVSSYRFFESLEAGCVPVVISDQYNSPVSNQDLPYFLQLEERRISNLEAFVLQNEPDYETLSRNASLIYQKHFADESKIQFIGDAIDSLLRTSTLKSATAVRNYQRKVLFYNLIDITLKRIKMSISRLVHSLLTK
jgi:hypothetical protein